MKRIVAFIILALCGFGIIVGSNKGEYCFDGLEKVCFVTNDLSLSSAENAVISGNYVYITVNPDEAKEVYNNLKDIKGYVLYFNKDCRERLIGNLLDYHSTEYYVGDTCVINGYSTDYVDYRLVDGKKYNVQMAFTEENIIVGYPMILTGF